MRLSSSAIGCSNSRNVVSIGARILAQGASSVLYRQGVERAPEVPGGHRAPGPPCLAQLVHGAHGDPAPPEVGKADALLQPQIVEREHIRAQEAEDEEH